MTTLATIRPESPADFDAIDEVNYQAFGQAAEGDLVRRLRDDGHTLHSLVAIDERDNLVGHILFSRLKIVAPDATTNAVALAPMAVVPAHQRRGVGSRLVEEGLVRCRNDGERIVVVVGHPEYYPRFGFSSTLAARLVPPFDVPAEAWMALELIPSALACVEGRVEYAPPFSAVT